MKRSRGSMVKVRLKVRKRKGRTSLSGEVREGLSSASAGFNLTLCTVLRIIDLLDGIIWALSMTCSEIVGSLNHEGIACFAEYLFLLEILVLRKFKNPIQKIISLKACLSYFFLYPMNVMRDAIEFWFTPHYLSLCACLMQTLNQRIKK